MDDPTIDFNLIGFQALQAALYSPTPISGGLLRSRILLARTRRGNYAKFQVHAGSHLMISRLLVYSPSGCVIRKAENLLVRGTYLCDLENASESSTGGDLFWRADSPGVNFLAPINGSALYAWAGFDDVAFDDVRNAAFSPERIEPFALRDQLIYCRTRKGHFAKLLVEWAGSLIVRRWVVYGDDGGVLVDEKDVGIPQTYTLDLETGTVGGSEYDLQFVAVTDNEFYLAPLGGAAISYASYYRYQKYLPLLRSAEIRAAIVFVDGDGTRSFDEWSAVEKLQLGEYLYAREMGIAPPIAGPPALNDDRYAGYRYMSRCDAWKIYLAHAAQSLWVEANRLVPWSIIGGGDESLADLFDMRALLIFVPDHGHSFSPDVMGTVTDWSPGISYDFLAKSGLIKTGPWETIQALADWCRANLVHSTSWQSDHDAQGNPFQSEDDQLRYLFGYAGWPPVDKMIEPLPGRDHVSAGCWGTDGFLAAVLRAVNVPVRHGRTNLSGVIHSRSEFFTVGRNLAHGDDPYDGRIRLGVNNAPIARVFFTNEELGTLIDAPTPLPGMDVPATTSFNHEGRFIALAVEFKTNYLLVRRCADVRSGFTAGPSSQIDGALGPHYSTAELDGIKADCDAAIAAIPGGCASIKQP